MIKLIWAIVYIPIAIIKTIFQYVFGVMCIDCGKRTRDFSIDRVGLAYCRSCWIKKMGKVTTI